MKLAISGKGSVGKTTLAALLAQVYIVRTQEVCLERLLAALDSF